uniref:Plastid RNA-binding protein 1 n=1 Tax=Nicotiana benthamiana TaxID=4100 RepID=D9J062_NICBE|nr:plastid RNA-binding protein 1 [Nicotiana benthamiana]
MSLLQSPFLVAPYQSLSSSKTISGASQLFLSTKFCTLNLSTTTITNIPYKSSTIRMGGGPRTYPGGVSKWQWKRMQAKKAKQLLKARLARERQIYEMRKRAELKAAVSELERPWEVVEKAPTLFSVSADEQLSVLADRFQKPGGFDMWSDKDGPELFKPEDGLPSARFFPKGVVHSIKPYGKIENAVGGFEDSSNFGSDSQSESDRKVRMKSNRHERNSRILRTGSDREGKEGYLDMEDNNKVSIDGNDRKGMQNKFGKNANRRKMFGHPDKFSSVETGMSRIKNKSQRPADHDGEHGRFNVVDKFDDSDSPVFELNLQDDGSYQL